MDIFLKDNKYHIPYVCKECGGVMIFKGVGEYHCENCGAVDYDDYGKVRLYIEQHPGANATQIEAETGIPQQTTRMLLREGRLEVSADSRTFLHCELCGKAIRSGIYCPECEIKIHRNMEEKQRESLKKKKNVHGVGMNQSDSDGKKRFIRTND